MPAETSEGLRKALARASKDINEHAHGLPDGSPQKPPNERLAKAVEALAALVERIESCPLAVFAIFCLTVHDLLEDGVQKGLDAKFHAEFTSDDDAPPIDERDDSFYLNDSRLGEILAAIGPTDEWHVVVLRGLNKICTGRKKTDPVKGMVELVITLVKLLAQPTLVWSNKTNKTFVSGATDRVRQIVTAPQTGSNETNLRLQVSALQQEMVERLAQFEADKAAAVQAVRDELQPKLDAAIDAHDREKEKLAGAEAHIELLRPMEDKYNQLYREHEKCAATADASANSNGNPDGLSELTTRAADLAERLRVSEQSWEQLNQILVERTAELEKALISNAELTALLQERAGSTEGDPGQPSPNSISIPTTAHARLDTELMEALARVNEVVARLGSLVVERATRSSF